MADGVAITAGSGTTIATDDCGAPGHAQIVKLAISTDGSATAIPADGTAGLKVDLGADNDVTVTGTVTANLAAGTNNIGDVDVLSLPAIPAGTNNIGDVDVLTVPAPLSTTGGGTEATALRVTLASDSTGVVSVDDNGGALTVDNGGTFVTQENGAALTALQLLDDPILTDDAAFTPATSKVKMVGFEVDDTSTDIVDEGDAGAARMTTDRRQLVQIGEPGAKDVVGGGSKTDTTDQSIMAAGGANTYNILVWLTLHNSSSTNTYATLKDGSTTRAVIPLPAYGGACLNFGRGIRATANTAWNVAAGASVTTAYFYGGGYLSLS